MTVSRTKRNLALSAGVATLALLLAACAPAAETTETPTAAPELTGVAYAQEHVDTFSQNVEGFVPSEPVGDVSSLKGKTVVFIPAVAQVPIFATAYTAFKEAFGNVGIDVQICDGKANPASVAACLDQAVDTGAAGVIMDALPPQIAQESYNKVVAAGIPFIHGNVPTPEGSPDTVITVGPDTTLATALAADAIIAKSAGTANVIGVTVIDSPITSGWMTTGAFAEFEKYCPDCSFQSVDTKTADIPTLPSKVSAAVLANPDADYLLPQLSPEIVPTMQGATDAGKAGLPAAATATALSDLQLLKEDKGLFASVGWDPVRTSWLAADAMIRLILGQKVNGDDYIAPVKIFTAENVADLDLTQAGWDSSDWFGGSDYQDQIKALWK